MRNQPIDHRDLEQALRMELGPNYDVAIATTSRDPSAAYFARSPARIRVTTLKPDGQHTHREFLFNAQEWGPKATVEISRITKAVQFDAMIETAADQHP